MNKLEIKIGEKLHTAKLGLSFLELTTKSENIDLTGLFEKFENETVFFVPKLITYAIQNAEGEITLKEVYDWLDETGINNPEVVKFTQAFAESIKVHFPQELKDEGKQKATKK